MFCSYLMLIFVFIIIQMVEPVMTLNVAGNEFSVRALTSSARRTSSGIADTQPESCLRKTQQLIQRFGRQIRQLMIGGISDFERRLGYIPDHQVCIVLHRLRNWIELSAKENRTQEDMKQWLSNFEIVAWVLNFSTQVTVPKYECLFGCSQNFWYFVNNAAYPTAGRCAR